jgi:signal transduction histidine kinase
MNEGVEKATLEMTLLTESVRSRASQARLAFLSTVVSIGAFTPLLLQTVPIERMLLWYVPVLAVLCWRLWIAARATRQSETMTERKAVKFDREFRLNSIINQTCVATAVWTVAPAGNEITPYFVTLIVSMFGMGAAASLGNDFRTVSMSLPMLFGQLIFYWGLKGMDGLHVALPLTTILVLVIAFSRQTQRIHTDSIAIRYENDALLKSLEEEKSTAIQAQHEAEEANRSKSRFLAAASHDLRQPLYAVTMLKDTLEMHDLPDSVRQIVSQQGVALDALSSLFDNLLQISRLESGNVEVHPESISVDRLLAQLADEIRPECERKGLMLDVDCDPGFVRADPELLGRLIRNLLSNAVRYTESGAIRILCRNTGNGSLVSIMDTGPGIPEADQQRVFQEFVQLNNPQRSREKGVGLGLSIVHHIAKILNLDVKLESTPGSGTTITVLLPAGAAPVNESVDQRREKARPGHGCYVWVVEDDELVRAAFKTHLGAMGVDVDFATSRHELQSLAATKCWPDFAILDDMLGGEETGLDIAYWLAERMPEAHILIATGNSEPVRLEELGRSPFEVKRKPVESEELLRWMAG